MLQTAVALRVPLLRIPTAHAGATSLKMCSSAATDPSVDEEVEPFARPNVRALTTTFVLSTTWTLAQLAGAIIARSSSLLSDALAMLVDDAAYGFNLAAELRPDQERAIKLAAPLVSATILLVVTALSFGDAVETLQTADTGGSEEVDGLLVLGFGAAMLLVDAMMLGAILFRAGTGKASTAREDAAAGEAGASSPPSPRFGPPVAWCQVSPRTELNLFSGLSHVAADTLRSLTQVVVGGLIIAGGPSETVDAYGTIVISGIILLGAVFLLYEVGLQCREWLSG